MTAPQPRFFYTDPLAAAWMAKHFGMRFMTRKGIGSRGLLFSQLLTAAHMNKEVAYLVSPDSEHMLEPQVGDTISTTDWDRGTFRMITNDMRLKLSKGLRDVRIIQRNGIAFHWPESEAA